MVSNPTTGQSLQQPRALPFIGAGRTRRGYALDRLWVMKLAAEPQSFGNEAGYGEKFPTLVTRTLWAGWIGVLFDEAVEGHCHHYLYGSIIRRAELFNPWLQEHRHETGVLKQSLFYLVALTSWLAMQHIALSDITVSNVGRDPLSREIPRVVFFDTAEWSTTQTEKYKIPCGLVRLLEKYDVELLETIRGLVRTYDGKASALWMACVGNVGPFAQHLLDAGIAKRGWDGTLLAVPAEEVQKITLGMPYDEADE